MQAVRIQKTGGPEVLEVVELPTPVPGDNQVLVKAHSIGVCMPEIMVRKGKYHWMPQHIWVESSWSCNRTLCSNNFGTPR
mgnify:CR=1 FL=1